jgi:WD40 repeat protein
MVTALGLVCLVSAGPQDSQATKAPGATKSKPATDRYGDPLPDGALARLGTTRLRHGGNVTFVAFGPDGRTLITAAADNVRIWDLASGREIRRFARPQPAAAGKPEKKKDLAEQKAELDMALEMMMAGGNNEPSFNVALAPDRKTLAASGSGNVIQLWDTETGKALRHIKGPPGRLAGLLFSPDGRTLAGRTANGGLVLWTADTGKELHRIQPPPRKQGNAIVLNLGGNPGVAPGMAFTPDSKSIAAAGTAPGQEPPVSTVKFWDIASGKEIRQIKAPAGASVSAVAFTPDGRLLAYSAGNAIHLCEADTSKEVGRLKTPDGGRVLIFSPDGKTLAALAGNQRVRLWETGTGKELHQFGDANPPRMSGGFAFVSGFTTAPTTRGLGFSPDGKQLAAASGTTVRIWETATGKEVPLLDGHRKALSAIALSGDGKVVVSWGDDRVIRRWDAGTGRSLGTFPAPPRTTLAALSHDGRTIALANADNTIRLHDNAGKELHRMKTHASAGVAFSPDGKMLASRGRADNTIRLYDVPRGAELRKIALRAENNPGAGNVLVIGGEGAPDKGPGPAFSPDGKLLATPRPDRAAGATIALLDVSTGRELRTIESSRKVAGLVFSPDGRTVATENADGTVTLWEAASGRQRGQLGSPGAEKRQSNAGMMGVVVVVDGIDLGGSSAAAGPVGLSFSPDGRTLAARGPGRAVRVWDVIAGKEVGRFNGHTGAIETVAFAADGKSLVTGAEDTTILLWDTAGPMKNLSRPAAVDLAPAALDSLWADLAGPDAGKAFDSTLKLASAPAVAVPFLGQRLKPAVVVDPRTVAGWIADLGSEKFSVRQQAAANLLNAGPQTVPALRKSLAAASLETRRRAEALLEQLTGGTLTADELRLVRAIDALERMETAPATGLLRTLAAGATGALPTREAQAALDRLARSTRP